MGKEKESERNIQWHPAFVCAMSMEFAEDRERLVFEREYQLNTKPLQIDLLIIKKERDVRIRNEIGHFFAEYNVLEYKAPGDRLDADVYYQAVAYGCLYKAYGETVDGRKAEDITVTLVREARPRELLGYFRDAGTAVEHVHPGIWHLSGSRILFPTQIVAIRELEGENHAWLRMLTDRPWKQDVDRFLELWRRLEGKAEREYAESILEVFAKANREWLRQRKGEKDMGPALMEIMEPELRQAEDRGREAGMREGIREGMREGMREGIRGTVNVLRGLGLEREQIREAVMRQYGLTEGETTPYL